MTHNCWHIHVASISLHSTCCKKPQIAIIAEIAGRSELKQLPPKVVAKPAGKQRSFSNLSQPHGISLCVCCSLGKELHSSLILHILPLQVARQRSNTGIVVCNRSAGLLQGFCFHDYLAEKYELKTPPRSMGKHDIDSSRYFCWFKLLLNPPRYVYTT